VISASRLAVRRPMRVPRPRRRPIMYHY